MLESESSEDEYEVTIFISVYSHNLYSSLLDRLCCQGPPPWCAEGAEAGARAVCQASPGLEFFHAEISLCLNLTDLLLFRVELQLSLLSLVQVRLVLDTLSPSRFQSRWLRLFAQIILLPLLFTDLLFSRSVLPRSLCWTPSPLARLLG